MTPAETTVVVETASFLSWWWVLGFFILGNIVGAVIYGLFYRKKYPPSGHHEDISEQLTHYRAAVLEHFNKTNVILQQLGQDYQHLIQHTSQSIHELCITPEGGPMIPPHFPSATPHSTQAQEQAVMPKTYVDTHKPRKE